MVEDDGEHGSATSPTVGEWRKSPTMPGGKNKASTTKQHYYQEQTGRVTTTNHQEDGRRMERGEE